MSTSEDAYRRSVSWALNMARDSRAAGAVSCTLNLSACAIRAEGLLHLLERLREEGDDVPEIRELRLRENGLAPDAASLLAAALSGASAVPALASVTRLVLDVNSVGDEGVGSVAAALAERGRAGTKGVRAVSFLSLAQNRIGPAGAAALAAALTAGNAGLTDLDVSSNPLGPDGARSVARVIAGVPSLTSLRAAFARIGDGGARAVAAALPNSALTSVHLGNNGITEDGAMALAKAIRDAPALRSLALCCANLSANRGRAAEALAAALPAQLVRLDLRGCSLGAHPGTVPAVLDAVVTRATGIEELNLSSNAIVDTHAGDIAALLRTHPSLRILALRANRIGNAGAQALAGALACNLALEDLELSHNAVGDTGAKALARALDANTTLLRLSLGNNNALRAAGRDALAAAIAKGPRVSVPFTRNQGVACLAVHRETRNGGPSWQALPPSLMKRMLSHYRVKQGARTLCRHSVRMTASVSPDLDDINGGDDGHGCSDGGCRKKRMTKKKKR